ncbi:MAG: glycosyltransferase family 39 protein [Acidobacteria bacterium]|nr:glycosyltransferase family 39 protein [Acidobacteriota bacterium]
MNALLAALAVILAGAVALTIPGGASAVVLCAACAYVAGLLLSRGEGEQRSFLIKVFVGGLLVRMAVGAVINGFQLQEFFGGDAFTYDYYGQAVLDAYRFKKGVLDTDVQVWVSGSGWGMLYIVASIYAIVGRNMLAVQFFNAVLGAATAPLIFLCARQIFQNQRVAKLAALSVAFYPSLVLWSSQALKDGPIVFILALTMLATLRLGERLSVKYMLVLGFSLFAVLSLRFYVFYMLAAAAGGAFLIGMRPQTSQSIARTLAIVLALGLGLTYFGVTRMASSTFEQYGNLEAVQRSRADLAHSANTGFGRDVDVSTTSGAISAIPLGLAYLLFAPFPWQLASLRQSITLPEMIVWWGAFPLLIIGIWFTLKHRFRQAMPILLFTTMLTLAYSIFQGNVGTAYRQRSQILVFYFIFVAVGAVLFKEKREDRDRELRLRRQAAADAVKGRRVYARWKERQGEDLERIAEDISGRINF